MKLQFIFWGNQDLLGLQDHLDMMALLVYQGQRVKRERMETEGVMVLQVKFLVFVLQFAVFASHCFTYISACLYRFSRITR